MLDAVRALVLAGGPAAASARAVCQATGASSGSVYHRFPRRDDLVAAAWLRAQDRFLAAFAKAARGEPAADEGSAAPEEATPEEAVPEEAAPGKAAPETAAPAGSSRENAVAAAVSVLAWCRDAPDDAHLLLRHALRDLIRGDVSPALADRARANQRALAATLAALGAGPDLMLAVVDLPYAVARRTLRGDAVPTDGDIDALRRAVTLLLQS